MDSTKINDWMQVVGIFAVVASLIFVGLEMRQSQKIALSAAYQARADSSMTLRTYSLESETLQSARVKRRQGKSIDQLTPEEALVLRDRWNAHLVYLENMHYQYVSGFISEEQWQTNRAELALLLSRTPEWSGPIVENCNSFRASFCAEIIAAARRGESSE
jgi:hypothetical protein